MEPLSDKELDDLLRDWRAPDAPQALEDRLFAESGKQAWWWWLVSGTIRVPAPVGLLAMFVFVALAVLAWHKPETQPKNRAVTLSDFRPVKRLEPRIIRSNYEDR